MGGMGPQSELMEAHSLYLMWPFALSSNARDKKEPNSKQDRAGQGRAGQSCCLWQVAQSEMFHGYPLRSVTLVKGSRCWKGTPPEPLTAHDLCTSPVLKGTMALLPELPIFPLCVLSVYHRAGTEGGR